jgi:hypothetical protein
VLVAGGTNGSSVMVNDHAVGATTATVGKASVWRCGRPSRRRWLFGLTLETCHEPLDPAAVVLCERPRHPYD